ncbi:DinB family protein [Chryseolinea sp. T2]|uniref:DinB family protein n=1 Tax=Chryseolinea sp. T2 TaxID=3129255 RepID=UPI003076C37B
MERVKWFERKFDFSADQNTLPTLIERLEGTPIRLAEKIRKIDPSRYKVKPDGKWSILEHVGHLSDLEPLWQGRLEDILAGAPEMRPTDLTNQQTNEANHNEESPRDLLDNFGMLRELTINQLKSLKGDDVFRSSLHPRLKTPMRVIDLFLFVAEHDDHHLASITELSVG